MAKGLPRSLAHAVPGTELAPRRIRYTAKNLALTVVSITTGAGSGTVVLGDFPEGNILLLGGAAYLRFSTADADITSATWNGDYAIGTTPDANVTIDTTDLDIINDGAGSPAAVAVGPAASKISPVTRGILNTTKLFDNTDGSLELNLNFLVDAGDIGDGATASFTVDGYVDLVYIVLGDD